MIITAILMIALVGMTIWLSWPTTDCGTNAACFEKKANACEEASMTVIDDRGSARITENGCVLRKRMISIQNATPRMAEYLEGSEMTCSYEAGLLPASITTSITSGTDICEGDLADRLIELRPYS